MTGHEVTELVGAACLVATGVSHWRHAAAWIALFEDWARRGEAGVLVHALLHTAVGALFVAGHPVFTGAAAVLTYWALAVLVKGLVYLAFPEFGLRVLRRLSPESARRLRWAGPPMVALGLVIAPIALA